MKRERQARIWLALLVAPVLALAAQSIVYALVTPLCSRQAGAWLHAVFLVFLIPTLLFGLRAWQEARRLAARQASEHEQPRGPNRLFLARTAAGVGLLSALTLLAMWIPQWLVPACQA
jgi:hypothetical protein